MTDNDGRSELITLYVHAAIVVLVVIATVLLGLKGKIDPQTVAVILSTVVGSSTARASQISGRGRRRNGDGNGD